MSWLGNVGRVARDEVEWAGERRDQIALQERDVEAEAIRVSARHLKRIGRNIDGKDLVAWALLLQRQGQRARTRTDIRHARGSPLVGHGFQ